MNGTEPNVTKKERRALRRQERQDAERGVGRRQMLLRFTRWGIGILAAAAVVVGIGYAARKGETPKPGETVPVQSRDHVAEGAAHDSYSTNPPTSGPHYERTEVPGIYEEELVDELVIHNLEHGAIWITYKPSRVDQATIDRLKKIAEPFKTKMLVSPREKNDDPIAVVAWQHILRFQALDDVGVQQIKDFISAYRNRGPENAPEETHR